MNVPQPMSPKTPTQAVFHPYGAADGEQKEAVAISSVAKKSTAINISVVKVKGCVHSGLDLPLA